MENNVTNAQLAAWTGCVPSTIQSWRNGSVPGYDMLKRLSLRLGLSTQFTRRLAKTGNLVSQMETRYKELGSPNENVSGRDFTDEGRPNSHTYQRKLRRKQRIEEMKHG